MTEPDLVIRPLEPTDSLEELTELLHRAYSELAAEGLNYTASYQTVEITRRRIDEGECWVVEYEGKIIATVVLTPPDRAAGHSWYQKPGTALFAQFAVEPEFQCQGVGSILLKFIEGRAAELGAMELALNTAEEAENLRAWYGRRGYELVEYRQWEGKSYRSVVLSKKLKS